ncbi:MAG: cytochrome c oxidase assembly protein [Alphaproteobacteria bacterium]|nr:cytochrome c oxidase assembly protein [Alphaproteobacteria bacterium]
MNQRDKNTATLKMVLVIVAVMLGLSFASVPLYDLFCRVTGYDGTTQVAVKAPDRITGRVVHVRLNTDIDSALPWKFSAEEKKLTVKAGEQRLLAFNAVNESDLPTGGVALYNVTPAKVGKYFNKTQCFCFQEQVIGPGQSVTFPVVFFIDPEFAEDPAMRDVDTITLSYTYYKSSTKRLDDALEDFYNQPNE